MFDSAESKEVVVMSAREIHSSSLLLACLLVAWMGGDGTYPLSAKGDEADADVALSRYLIGYREFRTNLPGGRQANVETSRAYLVRADGTDRRELAAELIQDEHVYITFAYPNGWSPDGRTAILGCGRKSAENSAWEEANRSFRTSEGWHYDMYLLDLATGKTTNVSAPERLSNYNNGLSYWPGNPKKLLGSAVIGGVEHPVSMDLDGSNKLDLTVGSSEYVYGAAVSPDGSRIAYHSNYQIYIANADGSNPRHVSTPNNFNFAAQWSPDGQWVMFLSGEQTDSNPHLVRSDGTGLRKLADRNGHTGMTIMDVPDFHGGSSDIPVWSPVESQIYYTAKIGSSVELMRVSVDGTIDQLTQSAPETLNYMPAISPDGKWILFGSTSSGIRQLYVMSVDGGEAKAITNVPSGWGAMFGTWNPVPVAVSESSCWIPALTGGLGEVAAGDMLHD
jgi:hypothetical protein